MLKVSGLYKQFGNQLVLENIHHTFETGSKTVVLGANGSGKSTLLKLLSGATEPTAGSIVGNFSGVEIPQNQLPLQVGFAAPYMGLNPHFSLEETLKFHRQFCPFPDQFEEDYWLELAQLQKHKRKNLGGYSSGMLQRVRLLLALASDRPVALLDEPTSNLDRQGVEFYHQLVAAFGEGKTVVVGSNYLTEEYEFCTSEIVL